ncbi:MAG: non-canonical purine NTP pyrophosphatase [Patescibacteria group bacterium]
MKKILVATHNPGKITEYKEILGGHGLEFLLLSDLDISEESEENEKTFEENAIKKVEFYSELTDMPVLAEDSGLEIDFLNGEPGVYSRRWPGYKATDQELIDMALTKLKGVPLEKRGAQFRVVIAFKKNPKSKIVTAEGILRGIILEKPGAKIVPGFPFRSLFYLPEIDKVLGEATMEDEAKIAHRRIAIKKLLPFLID